MSHPYRLLLRTPSLKPALLSVLLSAIPIGTITVGLVLSVESWTGSLGSAGFVTASFTFGNAVGLTVQGVLIDRFGDRFVVLAAAAVSGSTLAVVAVGGPGFPMPILGGLVLLAGVTIPAITTAVRRSVPLLTADETVRSAGYAALSVMFQLAFAVGPLLVSVALLATGRASTALVVAAIMLLGAAATFGFAVPSRPAVGGGHDATDRAHLTELRPLFALYSIAASTGAATGMTAVTVPAVTHAAGAVVVAGFAFAASAAGDVAGALVFGSRRWPLNPRQQLSAALLAAGCLAIVVFLTSDTLWLFVLTIGVGGAVGAPVAIRLSSLLDELATPTSIGQAYGTLVSVGLIAAAAGTSLAGQLTRWLEPTQLLLGPAAILLLSAVLPVTTRPRARTR